MLKPANSFRDELETLHRTGSSNSRCAPQGLHSVEAFDKAVLHRLFRRDVVPVDPGALTPAEDRHRGQLRPLVVDDHLRLAAEDDQSIEFAGDAVAGDGGVGDEPKAFPAEVVDDGEHPGTAARR